MFNTLTNLLSAMREAGANRYFSKRLAPNDNSKNQVYLGGGFEALNIIPHGAIETDISERAGSVRRRDKAPVNFYWLDPEGFGRAPDAQLILYPKYPEVRMSGFLKGAERAPRALMVSRDEGRVLFFGICPDGRVLGYVADGQSAVVRELDAAGDLPLEGVFHNLERLAAPDGADSRTRLLNALRIVHHKGWIAGQKMGSDRVVRAYRAQNAGGYTLEAELGIVPNGDAEPDFLGWEVKQYAVSNFDHFTPKNPVTLFTPEPTLGLYRDDIAEFMRRHGYDDKKGKPGRRNFGGIYRNNRTYKDGSHFHLDTGLRLMIEGYDSAKGLITDMGGGLSLVDASDRIASGWTFKRLLDHWNRKHNRAVYVPSMSDGTPKRYCYGQRVKLGTGTDFLKFMRQVADGLLYLDPAFNMQNGRIERPRHQFRIAHKDLSHLYDQFESVNL